MALVPCDASQSRAKSDAMSRMPPSCRDLCWRPRRPSCRLEVERVLPAHKTPARGRGEVRRAHDSGGVAEAAEQLVPRPPSLRGIIVRHHAELRIARLQRGMNHVARDDGIGAWLADLHRVVVDGMAGSRDEGDEIVAGVLALDDVDAVGG